MSFWGRKNCERLYAASMGQKGRKTVESLLEQNDYMTRSFQKSVSKAIAEAKAAGAPIARWDNTCKRAYMEDPDGTRDYGDDEQGQASEMDSED